MDYKTLYTKTSINRLFALVAIPGIISMLMSSLYQIIDGAFVGNILGAEAFAAINLVMPFVIINFSIADLIGVGSSVPIAIRLGEKKEQEASNIFSCACLMIIGLGVVVGIIFYFGAESVLRLMGADGQLVDMSMEYLRVYAICTPLTTIIFAVDNYLRICGKVRFSMIINILMSIISVVLEFLFLFVFRFGIWGAALATCLGMIICALIAFVPFFRGTLQLRFIRPKMSRKVLISIFSNGFPSFLNNMAGRIISIVINIFLLRLGGATAVSVYGVLMYADGFIQPILYGLCDSLQPAIGYNYGAKNYSRIAAIRRKCFLICGSISIVMTGIMIFAREPIVRLFVKKEETELLSMSVHAMLLFTFCYLVRWLALATQSYFSAIGKATYAVILSMSVAFVFPIIGLIVLSGLGLDGIWLNMPFTAFFAAAVALFLLRRSFKEQHHIH